MKSTQQISSEEAELKRISRGEKIRIATVGIIGFSAAVFGSNFVISSHDKDAVENLKNANVTVEQNLNNHEEAAKNLTRTKQSIGEACMSSISDYMPGGTLASSDENTVVDDMLGETNLPCGETRKEIRNIVKPLRSAYEFEIQTAQQLSESEAQIEPLQATNEQSNTGEYILASLAILGITGFGSFAGFIWADDYRISQARRLP